VAQKTGCTAFGDFDALLDQVDAVSVAVPTLAHEHVGLHCLQAGCDVLIEKPIATSVEAADRLIASAETHGRLLQIGHVERYNPAVEALLSRVERPGFVEIHRLGAFASRSLEVDVIVDLMIHDIDIVHAMVPGEVDEVRAVGVPVLSDEIDIANARLELSGGCIVNMTASRVSLNRVRKVRIFEPSGYLSVDYSAQEVAQYRLGREGDQPTIEAVPVQVSRAEPLVRQLDDVLRSALTRRVPRVDGLSGRRALETALRIRDAMTHRGVSD
jgi:predicted dehydrogenase